mmetsp:Transcript_2486/g.6708  ORF Transcript_2486/g.6708 Transcript_2486/m.6708 type:complete len:270 (+) Transcript_2486:1032-1841(+)
MRFLPRGKQASERRKSDDEDTSERNETKTACRSVGCSLSDGFDRSRPDPTPRCSLSRFPRPTFPGAAAGKRNALDRVPLSSSPPWACGRAEPARTHNAPVRCSEDIAHAHARTRTRGERSRLKPSQQTTTTTTTTQRGIVFSRHTVGLLGAGCRRFLETERNGTSSPRTRIEDRIRRSPRSSTAPDPPWRDNRDPVTVRYPRAFSDAGHGTPERFRPRRTRIGSEHRPIVLVFGDPFVCQHGSFLPHGLRWTQHARKAINESILLTNRF